MLLFLGLAVGCSDDESDTDTEKDTEDERPDTEDPCDELTFHYSGPDAPVVGDTWTVLMKCDGATLQGAMTVRIAPDSAASVSSNEVTFLTAGDLTITLKSGYGTVEETVTIE